MGKLDNQVIEYCTLFKHLCKFEDSFLKSMRKIINDIMKVVAVFDTLQKLSNGTIELNKSNEQYTNHHIYGNAWHIYAQEDTIIVYDWDEDGKLIAIDIINHNEQSKGK